MSDLVQVPWQPECWLTPDTLALLEAASDHAGMHLLINGADGAWRAYAQQKAFHDAYVAYLNGTGPYAPPAADPDTGQRNHMRGAAFDLVRTDAEAQAACRSVGLIRDAVESWHWNNPRWASMPIIPTNAAAAASSATPITPTKKGPLMALSDDEQTELLTKVRLLDAFVRSGVGDSVERGKIGTDFGTNSLMGRVDTLQDYVYRGNGKSVQSGVAGRDFGAKSILGRIAAAFKS